MIYVYTCMLFIISVYRHVPYNIIWYLYTAVYTDLHCTTYIVRRTMYTLYVNVHKDMLEPAIPSVTPVTPIEPYCYVNDFDITRRCVFLSS